MVLAAKLAPVVDMLLDWNELLIYLEIILVFPTPFRLFEYVKEIKFIIFYLIRREEPLCKKAH